MGDLSFLMSVSVVFIPNSFSLRVLSSLVRFYLSVEVLIEFNHSSPQFKEHPYNP